MQDEPAEEVPCPPPPIQYIDRISKSVLATMLPDASGMSSSAFVCAVNAVQLGYFIFCNVGERIADRWSTRPALVAQVRWCSGSGMLPELRAGGRSSALFRFLLAIGVGGRWPTAPKAVAENVSVLIR